MSYHPLDKEKPNLYEPTTQDIYQMLAGDILPSKFEQTKKYEDQKSAWDDERKWRQSNFQAYLETLDTRTLLSMLRSGVASGYCWVSMMGEVPFSKVMDGQHATFENILRSILANRPHIPNKLEAKAIRRTRAKANHGKSKSRNR